MYWQKNMLKILAGEAKKGYKKKTIRDRTIKNMYKYAQTNRFHHDHRHQVYTYEFMYVYPESIPEENYFTATIVF